MLYLKMDDMELIPIASFYSQTGAFTPAPKGLYTDINFISDKNFIKNIYPKLEKIAYDFEAFHSIKILSQITDEDYQFLDMNEIQVSDSIGKYIVLLDQDKVKIFTLSISNQGPINFEGQKIFYTLSVVAPIEEEAEE